MNQHIPQSSSIITDDFGVRIDRANGVLIDCRNKDIQYYDIPECVRFIKCNAFQDCKNLNYIHIPSNVESIGVDAFRDSGLEFIDFSDTRLLIKGNPFCGCKNLFFESLPSNMKYENNILFIDRKVVGYYGCDKTVNIPEGINSIGTSAFENIDNICSIAMPNTLTRIDDKAFALCHNLYELELSDNLEVIGNRAFALCSRLKYLKNKSSNMFPNKLRTIGRYAFSGCKDLFSLESGSNLTVIDEYAFFNCSKLSSFKVSNPSLVIKLGAFDRCDSLNIRVPINCKSVFYSMLTTVDESRIYEE